MILRDLLRGLEALPSQQVGNMAIIPLVGQETTFDMVGTIEDIFLERDRAYDKLEMASGSEYPTIMPNGYTLITKEAAQDRTVINKTILPAKKSKMVAAFCVQSSQCGLMEKSKTDQRQVRLLPASVRRYAYLHRGAMGHVGTLWDYLQTYNSTQGISGNFLLSYFEHFKTQLDQFVAEFEIESHQRGVIVLINDEVVGVEISPNPMAFSAQWEKLIRDCYGSEAVALQSKYKKPDDAALFGDVDTLEGLDAKLQNCENREHLAAEAVVNAILDQTGTLAHRQLEGELKVSDVETGEYVGQAVIRGENIIDLTLLRREAAQRGFRFKK